MAKSINYTESKELREMAEKIKARYVHIVDYVDLDRIFFAFKGGDVPEHFTYEILGLKNDWVKHASSESLAEIKHYCIATTYDYYQNMTDTQLQWFMLDALYSCAPDMSGKLRRKNVHEFSRIISTLEDLDQSFNWRANPNLPDLLGDEIIAFGADEEE